MNPALLVCLFPTSVNAPLEQPAPLLVPLVASQEVAAAAAPKWTGSVSLGFTFQDGNTNSTTASGTFDALRDHAEVDRWTAKAFFNYGKQEDAAGDKTTNVDNQGASLKYDVFASKKLYYYGNVGAERNALADLNLRLLAGAGAGYQFTDSESFKFGADAGLTYFSEDLDNAATDDYVAARAGEKLTYQLSKNATLDHTGEVYPSLENADDVYAKADTRVRASLTEAMFGQVQYVLDYDNTPATGKERLDHRVLLTLGWSF